jgi:hypothetical protein
LGPDRVRRTPMPIDREVALASDRSTVENASASGIEALAAGFDIALVLTIRKPQRPNRVLEPTGFHLKQFTIRRRHEMIVELSQQV